MALIKCPECKKRISDTSIRCPFCDFVLINRIVEEQKIPVKKCQTNQNAVTNQVLKFLRFDWFFDFIDDIADNLSYIPLIGPVLSFVFKAVCALVLFAIVFGVIGVIIAGLSYASPLLAIEAILVGGTIVMYFYTNRKRKQAYYFWIVLAITILFPIVFVFA